MFFYVAEQIQNVLEPPTVELNSIETVVTMEGQDSLNINHSEVLYPTQCEVVIDPQPVDNSEFMHLTDTDNVTAPDCITIVELSHNSELLVEDAESQPHLAIQSAIKTSDPLSIACPSSSAAQTSGSFGETVSIVSQSQSVMTSPPPVSDQETSRTAQCQPASTADSIVYTDSQSSEIISVSDQSLKVTQSDDVKDQVSHPIGEMSQFNDENNQPSVTNNENFEQVQVLRYDEQEIAEPQALSYQHNDVDQSHKLYLEVNSASNLPENNHSVAETLYESTEDLALGNLPEASQVSELPPDTVSSQISLLSQENVVGVTEASESMQQTKADDHSSVSKCVNLLMKCSS